MNKLKPLRRYDGDYEDESSEPLALCENGSYVLYAAAQAREKVLVEALRTYLAISQWAA